MQPASRHVRLATGLDYHYLEWGQEHTHTIVLVHGFLDFCGGWSAMVREGLAQHFHVVAPDMRGHGDSDRVGAGGYYHFMDYVADLHSFIEKVGKAQVSLVGHSMGGSIVGYYAGSFGESLKHLVIMEGMGPPETQTSAPDRVKRWVRGWNRALEREPHTCTTLGDAASRLQRHDSLLSSGLALELAEAGTRVLPGGEFVFKHDPLHLTLGPTAYSVAIAGQFWQQIPCPVLLIDGALSTLQYGEEETSRRLSFLPAHTRIVLEDAGHMLQRHQPKQISQLLTDFMA